MPIKRIEGRPDLPCPHCDRLGGMYAYIHDVSTYGNLGAESAHTPNVCSYCEFELMGHYGLRHPDWETLGDQ